MLGEIVGNAANGVLRIPKIPTAIVVEINRISKGDKPIREEAPLKSIFSRK
jgi:hypothetical protein